MTKDKTETKDQKVENTSKSKNLIILFFMGKMLKFPKS